MAFPRVLNVHDRVAIAFCPVEQASDLLRYRLRSAHFIHIDSISLGYNSTQETIQPPGLAIIHRFTMKLLRVYNLEQSDPIVICTGTMSEQITNSSFLVGSFLLLGLGLDVDAVAESFKPVSHRFLAYDDQVTIETCWRALNHAYSQCSWLRCQTDLLNEQKLSCDEMDNIDMDEYAHYDSPLNGGFHVVVPGELLAFDCPADLPDGALWADAGGARRFGAAFYADMFADMGVDVVVRGGDEPYDASAFAARGIGVEELPVCGDGELSLAEMDRFLSLARLAPGMVAVHGGAGGLGGAGLLVAVWLMSAHEFAAAEALAWVRLAHPAAGALAAAQRRFLEDNEERMRCGRRGSLGHFSHSYSERRCEPTADELPPSARAASGGGSRAGERAAGGPPAQSLGGVMPRSVSAPRIFEFLGGGGGGGGGREDDVDE